MRGEIARTGLYTRMFALMLVALRFQLASAPVDPGVIVDWAGLGAVVCALIGVLLRWPFDRVQRFILLGTITDGTLSGVAFFVTLVFD